MFLLLGAGSQLVAQSFLDDYFARVARNQAEQPHWAYNQGWILSTRLPF
jgi:hypothetical protein